MLARRNGRIRAGAAVTAVSTALIGAGGAAGATGWRSAGTMSEARGGHTATLLQNGKVLVTAGTDGPLNPATAAVYEPTAGGWSQGGTLTKGARLHHAAALLQDGRVLVMGSSGCSCAAPKTSAELYDPLANTWSAAADMGTGRNGHTATTLANGQVLVAGGFGAAAPTSSAELYDAAGNAWSPTGSMATARTGHTATLLADGKVLVAGGPDASAEIYDPVAGTWSPTGTMGTGRSGHTATVLSGGRILVVGGTGSGGPLASAEIFDRTTGTWSSAGSMAVARARHAAAELPDGKVLVSGGRDSSYLASVEIYDPASGVWSAAPSLLQARDWHTATALPGGKVLVAGGYTKGDIADRATNSAERFPEEIVESPPPTPPAVGAPGPTGQPVAVADTIAPRAVLSGSRKQKLAKTITTAVACGTGEDCIASATGKLTVPGGAARVYNLTAAKPRTILRGQTGTLKLAIAAKTRSAAAKALRKRKKVRATLVITVKDKAGNARQLKRTIALSR